MVIKMDVTLILKIAGAGILVAICSQVLSKYGKEEQSTLVTIGGLIVVMLMLVGEMGELIETVRKIFSL